MSEPTLYQLADQLHGEMETLKRKYPGIHTITYRPLLGPLLTRELDKLAQAFQAANHAMGELLLPALSELALALSQLEPIPDLTNWEWLRVRFWLAIGREWRAERIIAEALDREN